MFTLAQHGDPEEQVARLRFLDAEFPQYEEFWRLFIVALTNRVHNVNNVWFRPQEELDAESRPAWHVEVAQLHYTTLLHLIRVFDLRRRGVRNRDSFLEAMVRLDAATDTAFELLGHCLIDRGTSASWNEDVGKKVRGRWGAQAGQPLKVVQDYRNCLLHARVRPEYQVVVDIAGQRTTVPYYMRLEKMKDSLDWRKATIEDAAPADAIVTEAWAEVLQYFRLSWNDELIPWAKANFTPAEVPAVVFGYTNLPGLSASADFPVPYHGGSISSTVTTTAMPPHD